MRAVKQSHVGLKRKNNEDNCGIYENLQILAVADGMGGHMAGEVASKMALDLVEEYLLANRTQLSEVPPQALKDAIFFANNEIYQYANNNKELRGMGTTITLALIEKNRIFIAHIGDSRAYLISDGKIRLITSDHSLVNELLKKGGITIEEAQKHPQRNVLTRAMGTAQNPDIDFYEVEVKEGDILLLCTDGLSNLVSKKEIVDWVLRSQELEAGADLLMKAALERGAPDNISLVLGRI